MRRESSTFGDFLLGLFIAIGLVGFGYMFSTTLIKIKNMERTVSVKGLSQRQVQANIAIYPIGFSVADNNPAQLYRKLNTDKNIVVDFLKKQGFENNEIFISSPQITDNFAQGYNSNARFRYVGRVIITLYTKQVDKTINLGKKLFELNKQGVMASNLQFQTKYIYTKLNSIKPQMIDEATKNAKKAAEKFAKDSNTRLNGIKSAKQGYFSITDRDSNTPYIKKVRVVTSVVYYLK